MNLDKKKATDLTTSAPTDMNQSLNLNTREIPGSHAGDRVPAIGHKDKKRLRAFTLSLFLSCYCLGADLALISSAASLPLMWSIVSSSMATASSPFSTALEMRLSSCSGE